MSTFHHLCAGHEDVLNTHIRSNVKEDTCGPLYKLITVMNILGHHRVDYLKVDIRRCRMKIYMNSLRIDYHDNCNLNIMFSEIADTTDLSSLWSGNVTFNLF